MRAGGINIAAWLMFFMVMNNHFVFLTAVVVTEMVPGTTQAGHDRITTTTTLGLVNGAT